MESRGICKTTPAYEGPCGPFWNVQGYNARARANFAAVCGTSWPQIDGGVKKPAAAVTAAPVATVQHVAAVAGAHSISAAHTAEVHAHAVALAAAAERVVRLEVKVAALKQEFKTCEGAACSKLKKKVRRVSGALHSAKHIAAAHHAVHHVAELKSKLATLKHEIATCKGDSCAALKAKEAPLEHSLVKAKVAAVKAVVAAAHHAAVHVAKLEVKLTALQHKVATCAGAACAALQTKLHALVHVLGKAKVAAATTVALIKHVDHTAHTSHAAAVAVKHMAKLEIKVAALKQELKTCKGASCAVLKKQVRRVSGALHQARRVAAAHHAAHKVAELESQHVTLKHEIATCTGAACAALKAKEVHLVHSLGQAKHAATKIASKAAHHAAVHVAKLEVKLTALQHKVATCAGAACAALQAKLRNLVHALGKAKVAAAATVVLTKHVGHSAHTARAVAKVHAAAVRSAHKRMAKLRAVRAALKHQVAACKGHACAAVRAKLRHVTRALHHAAVHHAHALSVQLHAVKLRLQACKGAACAALKTELHRVVLSLHRAHRRIAKHAHASRQFSRRHQMSHHQRRSRCAFDV
jgi:hypothetical protein